MNISKVTFLIIAVSVAVAVGVTIAITQLDKSKVIALPKNQFTDKIEKDIEQLKEKPDSMFCKEFYNGISAEIISFHKQIRFGEKMDTSGKKTYDTLANDQWKENLEKTLYSAYAEKFIAQTKSVFRGSEWETEKLRFIRSEYQELQNSPLLESDGPVDNKFNEIRNIFIKYDEINAFISTSREFSFSGNNLLDHFPLSTVRDKITRSRTYLNNSLENEYVNNCTRLRGGLREIPQLLFRAHVRYLSNKINDWSGKYSDSNFGFTSQIDYRNNLYDPLKSEINILDNDIYNVPNFESEYARLHKRWDDDGIEAYIYFNNLKIKEKEE